MKKKLTLLVIEDDKKTCEDLEDHFATCDDMTVLESTNDANIALKLASAYLPNVILLDLELHFGGGNGLMFLDKLKEEKMSQAPFIIVVTQNMSEFTLSQARELGADFIITKYDPCYSPEYVASTIRLLQGAILRKNTSVAQHKNPSPAQLENLMEMRIQREMELIGINPKNKGFNYLVDAISFYIKDPNVNLTRSLVTKYKKTDKSIERAMQNAIKRAWDTNDIDDLLRYYTARIRADKGFPTLMEFICYYSNRIKNDVEAEKLGNKRW